MFKKHFNNANLITKFIILFSLEYISASILYTNTNSSKITVGDRVHFTVSAIVSKGTSIVPPGADGNFGKNIVVKEWNVKKTEKENSDSIAFEYVLTTYIPENCTIPALPYIEELGTKKDTLFSQPITLTVESIITSDSADIKDLKPLQEAGKKPLWWLLLIIILACCIGAFITGKHLFKRFKKSETPPPPKPPYEEAVDALKELENKRYLEKGLIREYVFELSEIFKRYIARRFEINAEEFTTEEMIAWSGVSNLDKKYRSSIEWFFRTSDPVKFAKFIPDSEILVRFINEIRQFLEATKPLLQEINTGKETTPKSSPSLSPAQPANDGKSNILQGEKS